MENGAFAPLEAVKSVTEFSHFYLKMENDVSTCTYLSASGKFKDGSQCFCQLKIFEGQL